MDITLQLLDGNSGRVAFIWLALIVLAVVALGGLALPRGVRRPRQISAWLADSAAQKRAEMERRAAEAQEIIRYAEEIDVASHGATVTAERRREQCVEAQAAVERAWQAWQDADTALERARRATAFRSDAEAENPLSDEDRAQALRRAAESAHRRGDISDDQLMDALTHRNGWDPSLHPLEQELVLARATVEHRFDLYQRSLDAEDEAWKLADVATAAVRTLRQEVTAAKLRADAARDALPEQARAILDRAGANAVVVTTQRITAETVAEAAAEAARSAQPSSATGFSALGFGDTTVIVTTAAAQQQAAAEATQEVRPATRGGRRELPSWAQPTGSRPRIAGAR